MRRTDTAAQLIKLAASYCMVQPSSGINS